MWARVCNLDVAKHARACERETREQFETRVARSSYAGRALKGAVVEVIGPNESLAPPCHSLQPPPPSEILPLASLTPADVDLVPRRIVARLRTKSVRPVFSCESGGPTPDLKGAHPAHQQALRQAEHEYPPLSALHRAQLRPKTSSCQLKRPLPAPPVRFALTFRFSRVLKYFCVR